MITSVSSSSPYTAFQAHDRSSVGAAPSITEADLQSLGKLKARDREVRAHEAAHQSVGGVHAGAASFTYQRGPDGVQYAIGGEVPIDLATVEGNPQATIEKMRTVQAAALAPAQPSSQDRAVAAEAARILLQAQAELVQNTHSSRIQAVQPPEKDGRAAVDTYRSISGMSQTNTEERLSGTQLQA
ncbi:putative metalloprotease CJM1_0395 family protein [Marinobacter zhejiangensis]|uniref:SprA-related family protein n=1 Tax=Marinobacter zhejiangensis TaxID=488535 RepID=A0A1I4QJC1_9GAMM|nr:putative metalloprotease CJM1_0395 family protein [Marinobacter zhejiangensis]SFM40222.1 SprA-related family protein [Marinobacter zhejiangensis]